MAKVAQLMEKNDACEDHKEQKMAEFHASVLERHDRASLVIFKSRCQQHSWRS